MWRLKREFSILNERKRYLNNKMSLFKANRKARIQCLNFVSQFLFSFMNFASNGAETFIYKGGEERFFFCIPIVSFTDRRMKYCCNNIVT